MKLAHAAFVISPIKKIRSCPTLNTYMSQPISPTTAKREIIVGSALAISSTLLLGDHHHLMTFKEVEGYVTGSTIDIMSSLNADRRSFQNRILRLGKFRAFAFVVLMPVLIRFITFVGVQALF